MAELPSRPNYFQSQFLIVRDFKDEQSYHEEMRRRHNQYLHEWGAVRDGLQVNATGDKQNFSISPGAALDSLGREIILEKEQLLSAVKVQAAAKAAGPGQDVFVTVAFQEIDSDSPDDKYPPPNGTVNVTRKVQSPIVDAAKNPPTDGTVVILARIPVAENGDLGPPDNSARKLAGSFIPRSSSLSLGGLSLDGPLSFTAKSGPNPTYPQVGLDYDLATDGLRIRARTQNAPALDATYLTVKRDTGNVGIGTTSPNTSLVIFKKAVGAIGPILTLYNNGGQVGAGAAIDFNSYDVGTNDAPARICFVDDGSWSGHLAFYTKDFGAMANRQTERLRITSSGNVGIGTIDPKGNRLAIFRALGSDDVSKFQHDLQLEIRSGLGTLKSRAVALGLLDNGKGVLQVKEWNVGYNDLLLNPVGGNVGIGTTAPLYKLHAVASGGFGNENADGTSQAGNVPIIAQSNSTAIGIVNGSGRPAFALNIDGDGGSTTVRGVVTFNDRYDGNWHASLSLKNGNVGIGTSSPTTSLVIFKKAVGAVGPILTLYNDGGSPGAGAAIDFNGCDVGTNKATARISSIDDGHYSSHLAFHTKDSGALANDQTERLRIASSGNVGIGTIDPGDNRLAIFRALGSDDASAYQHKLQLEIRSGLGTYKSRSVALGLLDNGKGVLQVKESNVGYNDLLLNPVAGKVGIGAANPLGPLSVGDASVDGSDGYIVIGKKAVNATRQYRIGFDSGFNFVIGDYGYSNIAQAWSSPFAIHWQAPSSSFYISSDGNVGIGRTNLLQAKLHVQGNVRIEGAISGNSAVGGDAARIQGWGGEFAFKSDNYDNVQVWNVTSGAWKHFIIDHPLDEERYLVHATLEGPEGGVYYRGSARLEDGRAEIRLPRYFEALTRREGRSIILTNIGGFDRIAVRKVDDEKIKDGRFIVISENPHSSQEFDWEVKAVRSDGPPFNVEPRKKDIRVGGFGPYTYEILE